MNLDTNLIKLNKSFVTKVEAIEYCAKLFENNGYTSSDYKEDMLQRDEECSVYIGNKIAIPHGLSASLGKIKKTGICVVQVPEGVRFETGTAELLIGIAAKNDEQIEILSNIANICIDMEQVEELIKAKDEQEIIRILKMKGDDE